MKREVVTDVVGMLKDLVVVGSCRMDGHGLKKCV